jgi:hypothetical protein
MKKAFLILSGITMFCFINYGFIQWLNSGHTFIDVLKTLTQDWLLLITVVDACLFTLLCFIWLFADMKKRGFSSLKKAFIFLSVIFTGISAFFIYLAFRPKTRADAF